MKHSLFKKIFAMLLILCIALSSTTIAASAAEGDAPATPTPPATPVTPAPPASPATPAPNIFKTTAKSFGVTKLYTTGLLAVGYGLTRLAAASECEEFEKIASIINVWVCGGNSTAQTLAEIQALCNEILDEIEHIEHKMDSYATYFSTREAQDRYDLLVKEMNAAWKSDIDNTISEHGLTSAMLDFFEYEDLTPVSDDDTNRNIGYFAAASCYNNNTPDKYGKTYTEEEVQAKRKKLFNDFCAIYGGMPSEANTTEKKAEILFSSTVVDTKMQEAIRQLASDINAPDSYADTCARVAYQSFPNLSDQYEYVTNGINKQFMQITMVGLLYEEYLAMRGEFLEEKYPADTARWEVYKEDVQALSACTEELAGYMENRISKPLQLDTYYTLALNQYITPADTEDIVLFNENYLSETDSDDKLNSYNGHNIKADFTSEYMSFHRVAVPTGDGLDMYYILDVDTDGDGTGISAENAKTKKLIHRFDRNALDLYYSNCDAYNLRRCTYTDGINDFICPEGPQDEESLFQTDCYALSGSSPYSYLSEFYGFVPGNKGLYQMFTKSDIIPHADGWLTDDHIIYDTLDMKDSYVGFDASSDLVEKLNGKVAYEEDYTKKGYDKNTYDSYYTVILKQKSDALYNTISYSNTGFKNTDMYITDNNGNKIENGASVECGADLTLYIKPTNDRVLLSSLTMHRFNNQKTPDVPTSSETLLNRKNFDSLVVDKDSGYYKFTFNMPYSNASLELNTVESNHVFYDNTVNSTPVNFYAYRNTFLEGDDVEFIYNGKVDHIYLCSAEGITTVKMTYNKALDNSYGSFKMPDCDANILVTSGSFSEEDTPLLTKQNDSYIISGYEELLYMSALINSDNPEYTTASYVLTNDIDLKGKHWICVESFSGNFDGQGYTISNLNVETSAGEGTAQPLFRVIENNACVKSLIIDKAYVFPSQEGAGGIAGFNKGSVENCLVKNSNIQLGNCEYLGGIVGCNEGTINNSAVADTYLTRRWGGSSSRFMGGLAQNSTGSINNCFVYNCTFTNGTNKNNTLIAVMGRNPVANCFYTYAENANNNFDNIKTADEFAKGEVAYLLNNSVSDTTEVWYQNLEGENPDPYPVPFSTHGTVYKHTDNTYSNTEETEETQPPLVGVEKPTSPSPESSTDKGNTVDKDVVNTGVSVYFILFFTVVLCVGFIVILSYKSKHILKNK